MGHRQFPVATVYCAASKALWNAAVPVPATIIGSAESMNVLP